MNKYRHSQNKVIMTHYLYISILNLNAVHSINVTLHGHEQEGQGPHSNQKGKIDLL